MEFNISINLVTYKGLILLEFFYELSDELYLLVLFAKNTPLLGFVFPGELCLFLYNSDFDNPSDPVEEHLNNLWNLN